MENNVNTVRELILHAKEITKDKQKFITCSSNINGKWYKIKFTKSCVDVPKARGLYRLVIDMDECSLELGKPATTKGGKKIVTDDIIWVRHVVGLTQFTEEELKEMNRAKMAAVFGG